MIEKYIITVKVKGEQETTYVVNSPNKIHAIGKAYFEAQKGNQIHKEIVITEIKKENKTLYTIKQIKYPTRFVISTPEKTLIYYIVKGQHRLQTHQLKPILNSYNKAVSRLEYEKMYRRSIGIDSNN